MFFSTAWLLTLGFQILALSLLITKTFIIQMEATPPWSSLLPSSKSQHHLLWVRALSWVEETHFSVPEYSANPTTSLTSAFKQERPSVVQAGPSSRRPSASSPWGGSSPRSSSAQLSLEAEWQHHWAQPFCWLCAGHSPCLELLAWRTSSLYTNSRQPRHQTQRALRRAGWAFPFLPQIFLDTHKLGMRKFSCVQQCVCVNDCSNGVGLWSSMLWIQVLPCKFFGEDSHQFIWCYSAFFSNIMIMK